MKLPAKAHLVSVEGTKAFYVIVRCDRCHSVLNSGHWYSTRDLPHALRLADEHNAAFHDLGVVTEADILAENRAIARAEAHC